MAVDSLDGGWGWMVVLGSGFCHFFLLGINRSMGIVFVLLRERFDVSATQSSLAASIFVSVRALGGPIASKMSDRFGCRPVVMIGGVLLCLGMVFSAVADNIIQVYITFGVVAGVGGFMVFSPSYVAVSEWFDKKKGKAMAFSTLGTGFGSICMAPVVMALIQYYNYFGTMLIIGALLLNTCVGGALYRSPRCPLAGVKEVDRTIIVSLESNNQPSGKIGQPRCADADSNSEETKQDQSSSQNTDELTPYTCIKDEANNDIKITSSEKSTSQLSCAEDIRPKETPESRSRCTCIRSSLWTNFPFLIYCILVAGVQGCIQSVLIFLPARGRELGAGPEASALLLTLFGAFDMVGRFVFGFVFDFRWFRSRRTYLYTAVAMSFAIIAAVLGAADSYISLAAVTCVVALFEGGAHSQRATNVTELVEPSQMSIGVGLVILFQGLGNFYGPFVGGILRDRTGSYANCFVFGGMSLLFACLLTIIESFVRERRRRSAIRQNNAQTPGEVESA